MSIPFVYLGIPIGARADRLQTWEPVIAKFRSRLSAWRRKSVSFGGRICLIQSVLSALPLFYLSFFKVPICVVKICNRMMRDFLWGGSEEERKIAWVSWATICKPKDAGGLGIKDLTMFNKALLGKWMWKWRSDPNCLWSQVLQAKYSVGSFPQESAWWRDVQGACLVDEVSWFDAGTKKSVRMGNSTIFWHEDWAGFGSFRAKFFRLYHLSKLKWATINQCGNWINGTWQWEFLWRRPLVGREKIWAASLMADLSGTRLIEGSFDHWTWLASGDGLYSVNSAYLFLQGSLSLESDQVLSDVWRSLAPSKVKAFAWRVLLDRIASKENLLKRKVLVDQEQAQCNLCNGHLESTWHLLFSCSVSLSLWQRVADWLGLDLGMTTSPREHLTQFKIGWNNNQRRVSLTVWLAILWTLWIRRNSLVFRGNQFNHEEALDQIKRLSWSWMKANVKEFCYSFYDWHSNPLPCIQGL